MFHYIAVFKILLVECKGTCENATSDLRKPPKSSKLYEQSGGSHNPREDLVLPLTFPNF